MIICALIKDISVVCVSIRCKVGGLHDGQSARRVADGTLVEHATDCACVRSVRKLLEVLVHATRRDDAAADATQSSASDASVSEPTCKSAASVGSSGVHGRSFASEAARLRSTGGICSSHAKVQRAREYLLIYLRFMPRLTRLACTLVDRVEARA